MRGPGVFQNLPETYVWNYISIEFQEKKFPPIFLFSTPSLLIFKKNSLLHSYLELLSY